MCIFSSSNKRSRQNIDTYPDHECNICLEQINFRDSYSLMFTPCFHIFHTECLDKWLEIKNTCPSCRFILYNEEQEQDEDVLDIHPMLDFIVDQNELRNIFDQSGI